MSEWKITSREYVQSAEKQTEHFEIYINKNEWETLFWLRIYHNRRIFRDYITASNINEACLIADEKISQFIKEEIETINLLKKELG